MPIFPQSSHSLLELNLHFFLNKFFNQYLKGHLLFSGHLIVPVSNFNIFIDILFEIL